ncbi:MAG: hypothetical protein BJ554DRAFT_7693 [Olpidium bornovanus]|uniref:Uncharacterized protein n=1 Tax=Olpidium bornovanus TaxID=278681 RepID=A0A8H7ZW58_9FUNG|nr:MAG: hypothetical protein BJ554DRAFT_7693 [Olpidium bornovanus]
MHNGFPDFLRYRFNARFLFRLSIPSLSRSSQNDRSPRGTLGPA